ncbi:MAG: hypothetical protein IPI95_11180 [Flavobacteriales bacterium]|nr:hypothetical protein [Flavobacteriales bacterium]
MLRGSRNRRVAMKYMVHTNQSRAVRYLSETIGMLLGSTQMAIQISCAIMTMVTGCRQTLGSNVPFSKVNLNRKSSISTTIKGSVGSATPMPPRSSSSRLMDSGVAKTMKSRTLSAAVTTAQPAKSTAGSRFSQ